MPYEVKGKTVINKATQKSMGVSKSHSRAVAHLKALYANVPEARKSKKKKVKKKY